MIADAMSGSRPGARRESSDQYIKRLETLEAIANSFEGVEQSFAIQAGREVRIIVRPEEIDDLAAARLARDVSRKIEETMQYPGQIKVTVVRETRASRRRPLAMRVLMVGDVVGRPGREASTRCCRSSRRPCASTAWSRTARTRPPADGLTEKTASELFPPAST